jgi:hypothetical protein
VETAAEHVPIREDQTRHKGDKDKKPLQKNNKIKESMIAVCNQPQKIVWK